MVKEMTRWRFPGASRVLKTSPFPSLPSSSLSCQEREEEGGRRPGRGWVRSENRIDQRMPPEPDHRLLSPFRKKRNGIKPVPVLKSIW